MTTQETLIAAILACPDDDLPRYAYADWCEEMGDQDRADLIRVQLAIWNVERTCRCGRTTGGHPTKNGQHHNGPCAANRLRFSVNGQELLARQIEAGMLKFMNAILLNAPECSFVWRRGFIEEVHCPIGWWLQHGHACVRKHPLRRVVILDRQPGACLEGEDGYMWGWSLVGQIILSDKQAIPFEIWQHLPRTDGLASFDSSASAMEALSQACLAWAKAQSPQEPSA